eukprot:5061209-Amphidinium_carterae.1
MPHMCTRKKKKAAHQALPIPQAKRTRPPSPQRAFVRKAVPPPRKKRKPARLRRGVWQAMQC